VVGETTIGKSTNISSVMFDAKGDLVAQYATGKYATISVQPNEAAAATLWLEAPATANSISSSHPARTRSRTSAARAPTARTCFIWISTLSPTTAIPSAMPFSADPAPSHPDNTQGIGQCRCPG